MAILVCPESVGPIECRQLIESTPLPILSCLHRKKHSTLDIQPFVDCQKKFLILNKLYFDQLLGAARTQKLVKIFFSASFQPFLFISNLFQWFHSWKRTKKRVFVYSSKLVNMQKLVESLRGYRTFFSDFTGKGLKWTKKVEKQLKKGFNQFLGAPSTQKTRTLKLVEIHNNWLFLQSF